MEQLIRVKGGAEPIRRCIDRLPAWKVPKDQVAT